MCYYLNLFNALFRVNIYRLFSLTMKSKCTVAGCEIQTPHSKPARQPSLYRSVHWKKQQRNGVIAHRKCLLRKSFSYTSDSFSCLDSFCCVHLQSVSFGKCNTEDSLVVEVKGQNQNFSLDTLAQRESKMLLHLGTVILSCAFYSTTSMWFVKLIHIITHLFVS